MRNIKLTLLIMTMLIVNQEVAQAQQSVYYQKAAKLYRDAAAKTNCPSTRGKVLIEYAEWNERMVLVLAGSLSTAGEQPTTPVPTCDADMIGGSNGSLNSNSTIKPDPIKDMQLRQQQMQSELNNSESAADNAYQTAILNGRKNSEALLDATLAGATQISDPTGQLVYTGVGIALSFIMGSAEKKQERLEKEEALRKEELQKKLLIEAKDKFIRDILNINQYEFNDLISKERYASVLIVPNNFTPISQEIYFSIPVKVTKYSDGTYPLKDEIQKKLMESINSPYLNENKVYILYPLTNVDKFQTDFTKQMGSAHLISLKANLLNYSKVPFYQSDDNINNNVGFTQSPTNNKRNTKQGVSKPKQTAKNSDDFWSN